MSEIVKICEIEVFVMGQDVHSDLPPGARATYVATRVLLPAELPGEIPTYNYAYELRLKDGRVYEDIDPMWLRRLTPLELIAECGN